MIDGHYYGRDGQPITVDQWTALRDLTPYRVVAQTATHGLYISTVWLGINHEYRAGYPPAIFETMVFPEGPDGVEFGGELYQKRYATEQAAEAGHAAAVDCIVNGRPL